MAFYLTAAKSSRITKSTAKPRSPFVKSRKAGTPRRKPHPSNSSSDDDTLPPSAPPPTHTLSSPEILPHARLLAALAPNLSPTSPIPELMAHVLAHMFDAIPARAAGLSSPRIAAVLRFRARLPPIASLAQVHALAGAATRTERAVEGLVRGGVVRRVVVPGRGWGGSGTGEGVVEVAAWVGRAERAELPDAVRARYIACVRDEARALDFADHEVVALVQAGLLIRSPAIPARGASFLRPGESTWGDLTKVASAGTAYASGTADAVAGQARDHIPGGTGSQAEKAGAASNYMLSLPNTGPYLKLLNSARDHLLSLLSKSGPHRVMPLDRLKERWDGGASEEFGRRGERKGTLPGRTKKWREFYGLTFEWVLGECLGAGMVELFPTGSITIGVRAI